MSADIPAISPDVAVIMELFQLYKDARDEDREFYKALVVDKFKSLPAADQLAAIRTGALNPAMLTADTPVPPPRPVEAAPPVESTRPAHERAWMPSPAPSSVQRYEDPDVLAHITRLAPASKMKAKPALAADGMGHKASHRGAKVPRDFATFRTQMCKHHKAGNCKVGSTCFFAHGFSEMRQREQNVVDGLTTEQGVAYFQQHGRGPPPALRSQFEAAFKSAAQSSAMSSLAEKDDHSDHLAWQSPSTTTANDWRVAEASPSRRPAPTAVGSHTAISPRQGDALNVISSSSSSKAAGPTHGQDTAPVEPPATPKRPQPERFRVTMCSSVVKGIPCAHGDECWFAHSDADVRTTAQNEAEHIHSIADVLKLIQQQQKRQSQQQQVQHAQATGTIGSGLFAERAPPALAGVAAHEATVASPALATPLSIDNALYDFDAPVLRVHGPTSSSSPPPSARPSFLGGPVPVGAELQMGEKPSYAQTLSALPPAYTPVSAANLVSGERPPVSSPAATAAAAVGPNRFAAHFRTQLCTYYPTRCASGTQCRFAHGEDKLRTVEQNEADGLTSPEAINAFLSREEDALRRVSKPPVRPSATVAATMTTAQSDADARMLDTTGLSNDLIQVNDLSQSNEADATCTRVMRCDNHPAMKDLVSRREEKRVSPENVTAVDDILNLRKRLRKLCARYITEDYDARLLSSTAQKNARNREYQVLFGLLQ